MCRDHDSVVVFGYHGDVYIYIDTTVPEVVTDEASGDPEF